jgi:hypothetical protein
MSETLDQVLTDAKEQASVLRYHGHHDQARALEDFVSRVSGAASEYLAWMSETEATLYTGRTVEWLRGRFAAWEQRGLARYEHRRRHYRRIILEHRGNAEAARAAGERAGRGAA